MIRRRGKRRLNVIKIFLTASSIVPGNNLAGFNGSTARGRSQEQPWCRSKAHRTWRGCVSSHCRGVWGRPRAHRAENSPAPAEFQLFPSARRMGVRQHMVLLLHCSTAGAPEASSTRCKRKEAVKITAVAEQPGSFSKGGRCEEQGCGTRPRWMFW